MSMPGLMHNILVRKLNNYLRDFCTFTPRNRYKHRLKHTKKKKFSGKFVFQTSILKVKMNTITNIEAKPDVFHRYR